MNSRRQEAAPTLYVAGLYLLSLCLPAMRISGEPRKWYWGIQCLTYVPYVMTGLPWWANPCFLLGLTLLFLGRRRGAFWCGVFGALLASGTIFLVLPDLAAWISAMSSGLEKTFPLGPGYFVWLASMIGLTWSAKQLPQSAPPSSQ